MSALMQTLPFRAPAGRDTLQPDAEHEPELYVDLDGVVSRSMVRLAARAPKLVIFGDYGTGKTHLLHVLKATVDPERFAPVYVKLEAYGRVAESRTLHGDICAALEAAGLQRSAVQSPPEGLEPDILRAFAALAAEPDHPDVRAWLHARGITPTQSRKLGFSGRLADRARGVTYATIWRAFGHSIRQTTGRELLLLLDETETFQEIVDPTRAADLGVAVRELVDHANKDCGVVMGLTMPRVRRDLSVHPIFARSDVMSRVSDILIQLRGLEDEPRRRAFLSQLLDKLLLDPTALLQPPALDLLAQRGPDLARTQLVGVRRDPVQREYVKLLDWMVHDAELRGETLPLDERYVRSLLPALQVQA